MKFFSKLIQVGLCMLCTGALYAQSDRSNFVKENYTKKEVYITMRDGTRLFTSVFQPKDSSENYPILMCRTPYGVDPYGEQNYPESLGPNELLLREKYIFVYQDVRGRYMSEGDFQEMTPHIAVKKSNKDIDESSDTFDSIEWLLKNLRHHNGRVGLWGISYPGFYASASLPGAHPAIKAVSPQAPVTDEFIGDDANHKGAFYLMDNFGFMNYFDAERKGPVKDYGDNLFQVRFRDAYSFFLKMGPISNSNKSEYFNNKGLVWQQILQHDTYDSFWKARNIRTHLTNIKPATLVVGGWFDAEDLFGALETYKTIETKTPSNNNRLVMGPWTHGAWASGNWSFFATYDFKQNTSRFYQEKMETPFFNYYLKDKGTMDLPEAWVYETGSDQWKKYEQWPPTDMKPTPVYFQPKSKLGWTAAKDALAFSEYESDPSNPVPYSYGIHAGRNNEYMAEDQRFLSQRNDVLNYQTDTLTEDLTLSGSIAIDLFVSTTGTDADFVVKLIDVLPDNEPDYSSGDVRIRLAGSQRLVRAEPIRGKFRNSFEKPEPFEPGKIAEIKYEMPDIAHKFLKGHRIMIQVQSSWFPLVDRNPNKFMRIPEAKESDFVKAKIRLYHDSKNQSAVVLPILK